jgi:DNA polymerase III alpha subunit
MAAFAGYGFPKAHAASYAQVAWRSAWCKSHFPAEFMAAVLANWGGYYSQRVYLIEARRMGLRVRPPHINHSLESFCVAKTTPEPGQIASQQTLFMGLSQVRDLTHRTIAHILSRRPFSSLEDFLSRVDPRPQEAENLARVGALEGLGKIPAILDRIRLGAAWRPQQPALFTWDTQPDLDWTLSQKVAAQQELLGAAVDAHPLELVANQISAMNAMTTLDAAGRIGQKISVAGVRQAGRRSKTAHGDWMMFLTLEDLDGMMDVVVWPKAYQQSRHALASNGPILVSGSMVLDSKRGEPVLDADKIVTIP